jgi:salicylate hydroxylase
MRLASMNTTRGPRIAVIGAGIGGLTLAIALQRYGLDIDIYEQAAELREVGAAVALSANGTRFFELAGLGPRLASHWFEVSALIYRDGRTGRLIGHHPAGTAYRERFGAPYIGIHRADLQAVLSGAVGVDRIQLCKRLVGIDDSGARAALRFDDGSRAEADLVVGADGARSFVRRWMLGYDDALYTGCSGFRGIVPMDKMPSLPDPTALQFWVWGRADTCCTTRWATATSTSCWWNATRRPGPHATGSCRRPKVSSCGTSPSGIRRSSR